MVDTSMDSLLWHRYGISKSLPVRILNQQIQFTKILELWKAFAENDPMLEEAFLNNFDKSYHLLLGAKRQRQLCCQPDQVDNHSGSESVLFTPCVAVTRSGNE